MGITPNQALSRPAGLPAGRLVDGAGARTCAAEGRAKDAPWTPRAAPTRPAAELTVSPEVGELSETDPQ